jgi:hypothetical protein
MENNLDSRPGYSPIPVIRSRRFTGQASAKRVRDRILFAPGAPINRLRWNRLRFRYACQRSRACVCHIETVSLGLYFDDFAPIRRTIR